jgi:transcriptional regulator with XRE-family HTH domain
MSSSSKSKSSGQAPLQPNARAGTPGGAKLRAVREQAGRAQLWVEAEADLGTGYLQRVESGRVAQPGRVTVERILDALDARYSERRDVLELFGYVVATPLPTPDEIEWARASCQHELHDVPFPAYVLDCLPRLIAWNRFVPRLLGEAGATVLERLAGQSMLAPWFDPTSPFGALVAEPGVFLPALIRALRYEIERFRSEHWLTEMLTEMQATLPRFREYWIRAEQEPAPISAARVLTPVRLAVPGVGLLQFRLVSEPFVRDARFRLIYFVPADPTTMRRCASWATDEG